MQKECISDSLIAAVGREVARCNLFLKRQLNLEPAVGLEPMTC